MFRLKLKELRESLGISQARLAEEIGVSQSTVAMWEAGKNTPEHANLQKIAKLFDVSMGELLDDDPQKKPTRGEADELTEKDERDIEKRLEAMLASMDNDSGLMFSGEPLDDETRELLAESLRNSMRMARVIAKQKYTPKKYRPEGK